MKNENVKHTPGPWHMDYHTSIFSQCPAVYTKNNELVAHVIYGNTEDSARKAAFLISAAPELLAALEMVERELQPDYLTAEHSTQIRAAIDKARNG